MRGTSPSTFSMDELPPPDVLLVKENLSIYRPLIKVTLQRHEVVARAAPYLGN